MDLTISILLIFSAAIISFFIGRKMEKKLHNDSSEKAKTEQLQAQFDQYKKDVELHFSASADLLGNMAQEYNNVYKHMTQAQQSLLPDSEVTISIPFKEQKEASLIKKVITDVETQDTSNVDSFQPNDYVQGTHNIISPTTDDKKST